MIFEEILNQYMQELNCTATYLSEKTGIPMTRISRYRNGVVAPNAESESIKQLAQALGEYAREQHITTLTYERIYESLRQSADEPFDYDALSHNLDLLIRTLGIQAGELALYCSCEPPAISRLRQGKQKPRNPSWLVQNIAHYVTKNYAQTTDQRKVIEIMGDDPEESFESHDDYRKTLIAWLSGKHANAKAMTRFFEQIDTFDLDEFLHAHHIGEVKIPTMPLQFPATKTYLGTKGMEAGIVAFLKASVLSRSSRDVIIYNDHPLDHCFDNTEFINQWMRGLAALILKGMHIHMIHTINRPFHEMMLGFEGWLPLYMTGQVSPYYLPEEPSTYHHLLLVSGKISLVGDAIASNLETGSYTLSKVNADVMRCRTRAEQLLANARPLVEMYRENRAQDFSEFLDKTYHTSGRKGYLSAPSLFTLDDTLLKQILSHNNVSSDETERIFAHVAELRARTIAQLEKKHVIEDSISLWTAKEFEAYPVALPLTFMFGSTDVFYTYEEYREHIEQTKEFATRYDSYLLDLDRKPDFRNIQIAVGGGAGDINDAEVTVDREKNSPDDIGYVLVSKNKTPAIHFVSRHPRIVSAMRELVMPIADDDEK